MQKYALGMEKLQQYVSVGIAETLSNAICAERLI